MEHILVPKTKEVLKEKKKRKEKERKEEKNKKTTLMGVGNTQRYTGAN